MTEITAGKPDLEPSPASSGGTAGDNLIWKERLQRATTAAQMFVWENDVAQGRQTWAGSAAQVIGCAEADLPDRPEDANFFVHPEDLPALLAGFAQIVQAGSADYAADFRTRDHRVFRAEAHIEYGEDGALHRVTGVTRDITDEVTARHRMVASDALARARTTELRALYDAAPVALCLLDRDLTILRTNEALSRIAGQEGEALVGRPLAEAMPWLYRELADPLRHALAGKALRGLEVSGRGDPQAPRITLRVNAVALREEGEAREGIVITLEDVTDERVAERALAEREAVLAAIGASSPQVIYAKDVEGRMLYANPATLAMLGLPIGQVLGRTSYDLMPNSGGRARLEADMKVMATGAITTRDEPVHMADGRDRILSTSRAPLRNTDGQLIGLVGLSSDVTEDRAAERRQSFLLQLADRLRSHGRPAMLAVEGLGQFFQLWHAGFAVAARTGAQLETLAEWGAPGAAGPLPPSRSLADFDDWIAQDLAQGRTVVIRDVQTDPRLTRREEFLSLAAQSLLAVPLMRDGRLVALVYLVDAVPRDWDAADAAMVRDVAERSWAAIEREKTEAALRLAEARHRKVLDASAAVVWAADAEGKFSTPQGGWAIYTGQPWPDHGGYGWVRKIHPDDQSALLRDWREALSSGARYQSEGRLWQAASQSWRHFIVRGVPLRDAEGRIQEWIGAITDIEDQRRAEEDLRRSETRLRLAKQAAGLGIFELDHLSGRIAWDAVSLAILRLSAAEVPDLSSFVARVHPEDRAGLTDGIRQALAGQDERRMAVDLRLITGHGQGAPLWVSLAAQVTQAEDGTARLVGLLRDITLHKANEAALQLLNRRLAERMAEAVAERDRLWTVTDDLLVTADFDGLIHEVSDSWPRVMGIEPAALEATAFASIVHPDDRPDLASALARLQSEGGSASLEVRVRAQDESWRQVSWRLAHERGSDRLYAVGRDVSAERAQAAALAIAQAQLHEAHKIETLGQLTGGVAHDFNNLLAAILSSLRSAETRLHDPAALRLIGGAVAAAERGVTLTSRLLSFARRQDLTTVVIDLAALLHGLRELLVGSLGPLVRLREAIPAGLPKVDSDVNQLELALLNLAVNARDAMPEGGDLLITARRAQVGTDDPDLAPGSFVVLSVIDSGSGMDEDLRRRAIEPFFTTKGVGKGTGLGLSMVYGLAAQSGGAMRLISAPGQGTTVELWLPVSAADALPAAPPPAEARPQSEVSLRILVVDDDPLVAMGTTAMLEDLGHQVVEVNSAAAALTALDAPGRFDLVLTDHSMPGMTGAELAQEIRARDATLPVILATGHADLSDKAAAALPRLAKPFGPSDLDDLVRRLCGPGRVLGD